MGLSTALALRHHGVACTVVERHPSTLDFPKGRGVSVRSMEIFRRWGIADRLERVAMTREDSLYVFFGESLLADEFRRVGAPRAVVTDSPTEMLLCDQMAMEAELLAVERGVEVRTSTTLARFEADHDGVTSHLAAADGTMVDVRSRWLVAADGAHSPIREVLGIGRSGAGRHGSAVSISFRAPIAERVRGRTAGIYHLSATPGATLLTVDNAERWLIIRNVDPASEAAELFTPAWATDLARRALGDPAVPIEILGIRQWESTTLVADRFRAGGVFLVGDAAHVTTPIGGLGMNCGIGDADNLAWKLAAVHHG
ncbi:MAG: FAD-dependent monooxygenase, partial [Acidimicrobiales bacterium]